MLALHLHQADRLAPAGKAAGGRASDGRGDVPLEGRVDAVLLPVDAAVVGDDRAQIAGAKLAADGRSGLTWPPAGGAVGGEGR